MISFKKFMQLEDSKVIDPKHGEIGSLKDNGKFISNDVNVKKIPKSAIIQHENPIQMRMTNIKLQKIT